MPHLYIIKLNDSTHYCGITNNIVQRLLDHGKGRSKSTRNKRPHTTKYIKEFPTLLAARIMEVRIKKQGVTRWWVRNQHREDNIFTATAQQVI